MDLMSNSPFTGKQKGITYLYSVNQNSPRLIRLVRKILDGLPWCLIDIELELRFIPG
jgi:hypothetical protein